MHVLADRLICEPFGMSRSSFVWSQRFDDNRASGHDAFGRPALSYKPGEANAAWSLQTTAADYSRFLLVVLDGSRLKPDTAELWLRPHVKINHPGTQCRGPTDGEVDTGVAWGLGWGHARTRLQRRSDNLLLLRQAPAPPALNRDDLGSLHRPRSSPSATSRRKPSASPSKAPSPSGYVSATIRRGHPLRRRQRSPANARALRASTRLSLRPHSATRRD